MCTLLSRQLVNGPAVYILVALFFQLTGSQHLQFTETMQTTLTGQATGFKDGILLLLKYVTASSHSLKKMLVNSEFVPWDLVLL